MHRSFFGFIWAFSARQQLVILAITCLSFPVVYFTLEVPKRIINSAIEGHRFPVDVLGMELEQLPYLFLLSGVFLALVILNNAIKFVLNLYRGVVGERMLRRLRYQLFDAILRFRPDAFRKLSGDQLIPMVTAEVEDLGHSISEAIATPAFQGGSLVVYLSFIFVQNVWLGLVAVSLYPLQAWLIPRLQRQVSMLARDRVRNLRAVAERVGSGVAGSEILHVDGTRAYHLADFSDRLQENYSIRLAIFKKKYLIKFTNNFMNQMPPFIFYAVGGYLVIKGDLSIGALVVSISAYQDISGPWKDLLGFYQRYATSAIKYETIVENFKPKERFADERFAEAAEAPTAVAAAPEVSVESAVLDIEEGRLSAVDLTAPAGRALAVIGEEESGRPELLQALAGLLPLSRGRILLGGKDLAALSEAEIGRLVGYVDSQPYLFDGSLADNLAYSLRLHQRGPALLPDAETKRRRHEALLTGNSPEEVHAEWTDYARAGVEDARGLEKRMVSLLAALGMGDDLVHFGLHARADPDSAVDFVARVLRARAAIAEEIAGDPKLAALIEPWQEDRINDSAVLAGNLLFGFPKEPAEGVEYLLADAPLVEVWRDCGLIEPLTAIGAEAAGRFIRLYLEETDATETLGENSPFGREELEDLRPAVAAYETKGAAALEEAQRRALIGVALRLKPGRYRLKTLTEEVRRRILAARAKTRAAWARFEGRYASFDRDSFIPSMDIEHNLLQGKIRLGRSQSRQIVASLVRRAIDREGLTERIQRYGLRHGVGVGGRGLSGHQRRLVALARALIKRPALLVADLGQGIDGDGVERLRGLHEGTLVLGLAEAAQARACDLAVLLREGRVAFEGRPDEMPAEGEREETTSLQALS